MGRTSSSKKKRSKSSKSSGKPAKRIKSGGTVQAKTYGTKVKRAARAMLNSTTQGFLGIEKKFYDTFLAPTNLGASTDATGGEYDPSATSMISTPAVGDGEQNRDGKRITIKSCQVKGFVDLTGATANGTIPQLANCKVFVALVLDTQSNAAQMNSEDCFKTMTGDARNNVNMLRNLLYAERFRVLKSEVIDLTPNTLTGTAANTYSFSGVSKCFEWFIPLDLVVNFNAGSTSSIANVVDNSLHIIAYATSGAPTQPTISYNARIRFLA